MRSSSFGSLQQRERLSALFFADARFPVRRFQRLADLLVLQSSSFRNTRPRSLRMMSSFTPSSSAARLMKAARWRSVCRVERIDVKLVLPRHQHIHFHQFVAEVLRKAANAKAAVAAARITISSPFTCDVLAWRTTGSAG